MALSKFTKDMQIIRALDDEPNDVGGLTAAQLKAKYDEGGEAVKEFVNEVLTQELDAFIARTDNPHGVTKAQVGLGACDDTADADKPVSGPQGAALALKANRTDVLEKDNAAAYTPTEDLHPATKGYVDATLAGAVMGEVPDHSVTEQKIAPGAVTLEKLGEDVTPGSLGAAAAGHTHTPGSIGAWTRDETAELIKNEIRRATPSTFQKLMTGRLI